MFPNSSECCLGDIFFTNANLMITHTEIKLGENLSTFELFEKLIDVAKWVLVLYGLLVQWTVVDTKSVRSILLLDENNTTTPWRRTRSDQTQTLLFIELFLQFLQLLGSKLVWTLANGFVATRPLMVCAAVHQCHPWISNSDTHSTNGGFITE